MNAIEFVPGQLQGGRVTAHMLNDRGTEAVVLVHRYGHPDSWVVASVNQASLMHGQWVAGEYLAERSAALDRYLRRVRRLLRHESLADADARPVHHVPHPRADLASRAV